MGVLPCLALPVSCFLLSATPPSLSPPQPDLTSTSTPCVVNLQRQVKPPPSRHLVFCTPRALMHAVHSLIGKTDRQSLTAHDSS